MTSILFTFVSFIFAVSILVAVHEYGHFCVARLFKVKVLKFSIGFGKPLFSWFDRYGTEYIVATIPVGGYVKMLEMADIEDTVEASKTIDLKPIWVRILIYAAGPLFNFLLAVFIYFVVFVMGMNVAIPIIGDVQQGSIAEKSGFYRGLEIQSVRGETVNSWEDVFLNLMPSVGIEHRITFKLKDTVLHSTFSASIDLSDWPYDTNDGHILQRIGFEPFDPIPPIVGAILPESPATHAELEVGDKFISVDGVTVDTRTELIHLIQQSLSKNLDVVVERGQEQFNLSIPLGAHMLDGGQEVGYLGVSFKNLPYPNEYLRVVRFPIGKSIYLAVQKTINMSHLTLLFLKKMIFGEISYRHIGGPLTIANYAGKSAKNGLQEFFIFLAVISINLAVFNLLPIPFLDGGHILYALIEGVIGREHCYEIAKYGNIIGFITIVCFMTIALQNDLIRLFS